MPATEDYEKYKGLAEELGLEDEEAGSFVNSAMKRRGYKPVVQWADNDDDDDDDGNSDFFSSKRNKRETRRVGGKQQPKKASGAGWQYD